MLFSCLFQCFEEKEYKMESKWNETFGGGIFGTEAIQETWSRHQGSFEVATRQGGAPAPWARPHPRGPLVAPLTDFFRLYISIYPKNIGEQNRSGVPATSPCSHQKPIGTLFQHPAGGGNPHRWPSSSSRRSP